MLIHLRWALTLALVVWQASQLASECRAGTVVSTFEEGDLAAKLDASQTFRGMTAPGGAAVPSDFRSGAVTFRNDGAGYEVYPSFVYEYWTGMGYARRTAPGNGQQLYEQGNDLIAKPAVGAAGSQTWAVAYESTTMTADPGYRFEGVDVTNTLYTWTSIANGDPFGPKFGANDFFTLRFTNPDTSASRDVNLADFRAGNNTIFTGWEHVDLSALDATRLNVSFLGSRSNAFGLTTPSYAALDNVAVAPAIAAVPEPSSLALLGLVGAVWAGRRRLGHCVRLHRLGTDQE